MSAHNGSGGMGGVKHPRYDIALEALSEAHQRIYEALYEAAYLGKPCPSNKDLVIKSGRAHASPRYATDAVASLEAVGLITVHRGYKARIVVLPSGQSTAGNPDEIEPLHASQGRTMATPAPNPERTSCSYCGVRSDLGCQHQPLEIAA